jgi:SPP1 family predicted phage head-tail adaptor
MRTKPYMVWAGDLDRRVVIEQRTVARDAALGSEVETWATLATVWARVKQSSTQSGVSEAPGDAAETFARPTMVWIRWREGISRQDHRLRLDDALLRIVGVAELGRRQALEIACLEWAHDS